MIQFLARYFSPCTLSLYLPLFIHIILRTIHFDDLQLQLSAPDKISKLLHPMQSCVSYVNIWTTANMLKFNDNKTRLMLVTSRRRKNLHNLPTLFTIGNVEISSSL